MSNRTAWASIALTAIVLGYMMLFLRGGFAEESWYHKQQINPEAQARLNTPYKSCCGAGDTFRTRFRLVNDGSKYGAETYEYEQDGKWKLVPFDIIKRAKTPDGRPVLFLMSKVTPVCFIIDEEGI